MMHCEYMQKETQSETFQMNPKSSQTKTFTAEDLKVNL